MKVALLQTRTPSTQEAALADLEPQVRAAARDGARLIATPEGTNLLQRDRSRLQSLRVGEDEDLVVTGLRALARELDVEILIGSVLVRRSDGLNANRCLMVDASGTIRARYDKIHMFDVNLPSGEEIRESRAYAPGDVALTTPSRAGRLGLTICYDLRFPHLYRGLAKAGAEILTTPSAFTKPTGEAHWEVLLRARAIENGAFVLAPAQGGLHEDGRRTFGRTLAVGPWGEVMGMLDHDEPGVLMVEIETAAVARARAAIPSLANERAFAPPLPAAADTPDMARLEAEAAA